MYENFDTEVAPFWSSLSPQCKINWLIGTAITAIVISSILAYPVARGFSNEGAPLVIGAVATIALSLLFVWTRLSTNNVANLSAFLLMALGIGRSA